MPALVGAAIVHRGLTWGLSTEPQTALNDRRIPRRAARSSAARVPSTAWPIIAATRRTTTIGLRPAAGWSWKEVLPYFRLSENNADRRDTAVHGIDGPIHVTFIPRPNRLNQAFADAFAAVGGFRHCEDFTGLDPEGYGLRQGTIHRGRRDSSASAMLMPALERPNLTVLSRTAVTGIRIEGGRATGVDVAAAGGPGQVRASREVLLCAGAVHSPSC